MHFALLIGDVPMTVFAAWTWFTSAWESLAQSAGSALVTSIWQGAVIVCGLEIAMRLMPRVSAAHRFSAWATGFGVAVVLPLLPHIHFGWGASGTSADAPGAVSADALFHLDARWGMLIAGLWVAASLVRAADLVAHSVRLRRLWKAARPVEVSESLGAALREVRAGHVEICRTRMVDRPSVIGFFAPRILIPAWLIDRVTPGELEQIVLHEAEHLRRGDDWMNLVQKVCLVLFPLNPSLAWMEHRLCSEREMACDEGVVRITKAPRAYAACLASLAERGLERRMEALSLGAWHRRPELVDRVHRILQRRPGMSKTASGVVLGALGCVMIAGSVEMARAPQVVAFAPKQTSLAMTPEQQQQLAALLAREEASSRMMLPPNFKAVQAKAVMPEAKQQPTSKPCKYGAHKTHPDAHEKNGVQGAEQIANAQQQTGDRVNADAGPKWVVLSAWEEVRTVSRSTVSVADYDTVTEERSWNAQNVQADAPQGKASSAGKRRSDAKAGETVNQFSMTRLILRVAPANSNSSSIQLPAMPVQGGWFVFQL
jgi:beta-lactamase regulating signal transducer with metallopeptidase domain